MKQIIITITNNISFDQRMHKVASTLSQDYNVLIIGSSTRNPPRLQTQNYQQLRVKTIFQTGKFFYLEFNLRLLLLLLFRNYDIHYSVDLDTLMVGYLMKKMRGKRLVYDAHEYFTELPELENRTFVKRIWKWVGNIGIPTSDLRITVNKPLAAELSKVYSNEFEVIRNVPVILETNETSKNENSKIILYQGALNTGRGIEYAIDAMHDLYDFELWIAGGGPLATDLQNRAKGLKNVKFLGMIPPNQLAELTGKAWLGLNLLEGESLNYYYSLANKFFDYAGMNVPSINMDFPAYRNLNEQIEVSYLITESQLNNLAEIIADIYDNRLKYNELRTNCKRAKLLWSWQNESKKLLDLFCILD